MHLQPRYNPEGPSTFFSDGRSARDPVPGTVARGQLRIDDHLYAGKVDGKDAEQFPFPIKAADMARGQQRYNIYCSPCHDYLGTGNGMIVQRGFPQPPSFHIDRLRQAPAGHFFAVMTNGYGAMYSYASRVSPEDRWRIAAYIRALQLSQQAQVADLSAEVKSKLQEQKP
jgi:cytochrome c